MRRRFAIFSLVLAAAPLLSAQTAQQAVLEVEKAWSAAIVSGDVSTLNRVLGDELTYGHASGASDTKASYISRIQSGAQKYKAFVPDDGLSAAPHIYGDTATLVASATVTSDTDGKPNTKHLRYLHVFVKRGGQWQLVAHQSVELHP